MERRSFLTLLLATPLVGAVAACGSDSDGAPAGDSIPPATDPSEPPTTDAPPSDVGPPGAIVEFGYYGGFTLRNIAFQMQPQVMITTDGRVLTPAPVMEIYPGPMVKPLNQRTITPAGVDAVIAAARERGLLAEVDYESNQNIADAATATLRLNVDGTTYLHEAYALDVGGPGTDADASPERQALAEFAERLTDLENLVGASALGPEEPYEPTGYQVTVFPAGDLSGIEPEPTVVDWPEGTGVTLADVSSCVEIDRDAVGDLFEQANELTFFTEGGQTYEVVPRPTLPGRTC